jgi:hypothetical protein
LDASPEESEACCAKDEVVGPLTGDNCRHDVTDLRRVGG